MVVGEASSAEPCHHDGLSAQESAHSLQVIQSRLPFGDAQKEIGHVGQDERILGNRLVRSCHDHLGPRWVHEVRRLTSQSPVVSFRLEIAVRQSEALLLGLF